MIYPKNTISVGKCITITRSRGSLAGEANTKDAYHHIWHDKVYWKSHRLSYCLNIGEIPRRPEDRKSGLVLHTCDNKWCINPDHLYLGSAKQNTADTFARNKTIRSNLAKANTGKKHSEVSKRKMSLNNIGKKLSGETKAKIGLAAIGNKNCLGRKQPLEERLKRARTMTGKKRSQESKDRMSRAIKLWWEKRKARAST